MHDGETIISVDWLGGGRTSGGERWDFDILESRTELRVLRGESRGDDGDGNGVLILVDNVLMDGRQKRRDPDDDVDADEYLFGFDLLLGGSDKFVSVLLHGPGALNCADRFTNMSRDMTSERIGVRKREGG